MIKNRIVVLLLVELVRILASGRSRDRRAPWLYLDDERQAARSTRLTIFFLRRFKSSK
jgi:hypothetical protein